MSAPNENTLSECSPHAAIGYAAQYDGVDYGLIGTLGRVADYDLSPLDLIVGTARSAPEE